MSTEETLNIEKNLGKLQKRMEEEKRDNNFQARVMEMARKVQNGKRFATLIKNLANPKLDFWNFLNELWIGYILIDYNPEYESKYINTNPDFKVVMNNQTVWIEVKDKEETTLEKDIRKKFNEIKPSCIEILAKKVQDKYSCSLDLDFFDIPPKEFNLVKRLEELPQKIEKISPEKIYEGSEVILDKGLFSESGRNYEYEIVLHFLTGYKEWAMAFGGGGINNDYFTSELLRDMLVGKTDNRGIIIKIDGNFKTDKSFENSVLHKFDNRNNNDITIGIIDPTSREIGIGDEKMSFDFSTAKEILENIIVGKKLANNPNRVTFPWYDEVKNKVDAIFLVCANPIRTSKSLEIEKFISSLSNENKIPVIEKIFNKICATQLPS